jgi:hypothetical protein
MSGLSTYKPRAANNVAALALEEIAKSMAVGTVERDMAFKIAEEWRAMGEHEFVKQAAGL